MEDTRRRLAFVRSLLFSYYSDQLHAKQRRQLETALSYLDRVDPHAWRVLHAAHVDKKEGIDWREEENAVRKLADLLAGIGFIQLQPSTA